MAISDKPDAPDGGPINGFLRRWRRNTSRAGVLTAALLVAVVTGAVLVFCACKSIMH